MIGMPPATAASNSRSTPGGVGGGEQLGADVGEQLLVGGDDRLAGCERCRVISSRAGSMPPITSTTRSTSGSLDDAVRVTGEHASRRGRRRVRADRLRTAMRVISSRSPVRGSIDGLLGPTSSTNDRADVAAPEHADPDRARRRSRRAGSGLVRHACWVRHGTQATGHPHPSPIPVPIRWSWSSGGGRPGAT